MGSKELISVNELCGAGLLDVGPVASFFTEMMLGLSNVSSWKCRRAATRILENSLASYVPATMGAVKRGHSDWQLSVKEYSERAADLIRESCTAAQNRAQSSFVSRVVVPGMGSGGDKDIIWTYSDLEYGVKWRSMQDVLRNVLDDGDVTMKQFVRQGS